MITAVDTSVLIAVTKGEPDAERWIDLLATARADGDLMICDIVAAEFFAALMNRQKFETSLRGLGISFVPTGLDAAQLAGRVFKAYRRQGGPREHLVPDFLIGAHATLQADRLAAIDRGYLRRYFPRLRLLKPA
jgi:predicted nucleic acid-binding protein